MTKLICLAAATLATTLALSMAGLTPLASPIYAPGEQNWAH